MYKMPNRLTYPPQIQRTPLRYPIPMICRCDICESFRKDSKKAVLSRE